jgi:nucleoside-diphosphate-sugar epimerase
MTHNTKKVLILGATGEIGSRIARGSVDAGHETTGVTRGTNDRHRVDTAGVNFITGDKKDEDFYKSVLAKNEYDVVIDSIPETEDVQLAHKYFAGRIEHYFMCSSVGTYAPLLYLPADENHPWREQTEVNFHHQSLRDEVALTLWEKEKFSVTIFRPTNIIGPGRVPLELWGGRSTLYFQLMRQGKTVEIPLMGNALLQSGYNDDLATAFVQAIPMGSEISGEIFNISCEKSLTLDQYFSVARDVLKSSSPVDHVSNEEILRRHPEETNDGGLRYLVEHCCYDIGKAKRMLGYSPEYSMEQGLANSLEWCLDQGLL